MYNATKEKLDEIVTGIYIAFFKIMIIVRTNEVDPDFKERR